GKFLRFLKERDVLPPIVSHPRTSTVCSNGICRGVLQPKATPLCTRLPHPGTGLGYTPRRRCPSGSVTTQKNTSDCSHFLTQPIGLIVLPVDLFNLHLELLTPSGRGTHLPHSGTPGIKTGTRHI